MGLVGELVGTGRTVTISVFVETIFQVNEIVSIMSNDV